MKLVVYGGIGEHGRNCFLIQGNHACFLLDAGTGGSGELPSLPSEVIPRLCCVFLSHSHADHSGALFLLAKYGFHGKLLATTETLAQISSPVPSLSLDHGHYGPVSWYWGRSGHCIGSAWLSIAFEGKRILYSGDYYEESGGYLCDPIRGQQADIALIDAAYGATDLSIEKAASTILGEIRRQLPSPPALPCSEAWPWPGLAQAVLASPRWNPDLGGQAATGRKTTGSPCILAAPVHG